MTSEPEYTVPQTLPVKLTGEIACILEDCSPPDKQTPEAVAALIEGYQPTWDRIRSVFTRSQAASAEPSASVREEIAAAELQIRVLQQMMATEDADIDFLINELRPSSGGRNVIRSFRKQIIQTAASYAADATPSPLMQAAGKAEPQASDGNAASPAVTAAEIFEWLETEISAIPTYSGGSPSMHHDAYWMKNEVCDLLKRAAGIFSDAERTSPQPSRIDAAAEPTREEVVEEISRYFGKYPHLCEQTADKILDLFIKPRGEPARCPNGLEHGACLHPECVSSCPGRLSLRGEPAREGGEDVAAVSRPQRQGVGQ